MTERVLMTMEDQIALRFIRCSRARRTVGWNVNTPTAGLEFARVMNAVALEQKAMAYEDIKLKH